MTDRALKWIIAIVVLLLFVVFVIRGTDKRPSPTAPVATEMNASG